MELVETDVEQCFNNCFVIGEGDVLQRAADFVIVLEYAEDESDLVEPFRLPRASRTSEAFPLGFQPGLLEGVAQLLPGGEFDECGTLGVLCLASGFLELTRIRQAGELEAVFCLQPGFYQCAG